MLTIRMSCEHHRVAFEGAFFSALLVAAGGARDALRGTIAEKRQGLIRRLREALAAANRGHVVALFCDEAQRLSSSDAKPAMLKCQHRKLLMRGTRWPTIFTGWTASTAPLTDVGSIKG